MSAIDATTEALQGCTEDDVEQLVARLCILFPHSKLTRQEEEIRLELYVQLLIDLPADSLVAALEALGKTARFFPAVAEIREAAEAYLKPLRQVRHALHSLEYNFRYEKLARGEPLPSLDPETAALVRERQAAVQIASGAAGTPC
jgi:hypothetical protein